MTLPVLPRTLVVFDFDHSLMDEDSDQFVQALGSPELRKEAASLYTTMQWTDLMDHVLVQLQTQQGLTAAQLRHELGKIKFHEDMRTAIREAKERAGAQLVILSDANTFFIESILEAFQCGDIFSRIITNPVAPDPATGLLRVKRYIGPEDPPHQCTRCAVNLCKGTELTELRKNGAFERVVYVGDGKNDICPTIRLTPSDIVLARNDLTLAKYWQSATASGPSPLQPQVFYWSTGTDVLRLFREHLLAPKQQQQDQQKQDDDVPSHHLATGDAAAQQLSPQAA